MEEQPQKIIFKKLHKDSIVPKKGSALAAGYDLFSYTDKEIIIEPLGKARIPTGISVELPHNTYGRNRTFTCSTGKKATVSGGDYGWLMDREKETDSLIRLIQKGAKKKKQPTYLQTAASHGTPDWGNTYVEINLSQQHLWYYKNKKLIIDSDFVSGNISKGYNTPQGVYSIMYLERNAILGARSNADYRTPVSYWMPFNGGIGMHDATWRSKFGGSIYLTNGSHGCINLPKAVAATIFANISSKTPVICYFN